MKKFTLGKRATEFEMAIVAEYRIGVPVSTIARRYKIARLTVYRVLRMHGLSTVGG